jgi:hypothetical protein
MTCRTGFVVAFSCKGRGVCPSCNGRHMAQTAAHLADHVIPPVPVRQWVISVPKRLRGMLADRPRAVAALSKIFLDEIERLLCAAVGVTRDAATPASARPRLGGISFLHRFGSALNHHAHLHACVTDGVFVPPADDAGCDASPAFLPTRPITQADLAARTDRVRRRVIRWFRMQRLLDAVAANWVGPGRGRKSTRPGASGLIELSPFEFLDRLADLIPPPRKHRHRYHGVFAPNHRLRKAVTALAIGNIGKQREAVTGGHGGGGHATGGCCDAHHKPRSHDTSRIA